ncbi:MAG: PQQ-dependent sugar dehydrogenase, partial [Burkholderiaceae bacterium]
MRRPARLPAMLLLSLASAWAWGQQPAPAGINPVPTPAAACAPVDNRTPNASGQTPAYAGQTRACAAPRSAPVKVTVLATGLDHPWAVEPLPDGALLVTERPGRLRIVSADGKLGAPIAGLPPVDARGQGGLLDVALSPAFASDRTIYWSYTEPREGGNGTSV